jgi:hypothetical protein
MIAAPLHRRDKCHSLETYCYPMYLDQCPCGRHQQSHDAGKGYVIGGMRRARMEVPLRQLFVYSAAAVGCQCPCSDDQGQPQKQ